MLKKKPDFKKSGFDLLLKEISLFEIVTLGYKLQVQIQFC